MDGKFRGFAQKKDEKINLNTLNKEVGLNPGDLVKYDREILKKINGCFSNENYGITLNKTIGRKLNKLAFLDEEHLLALDDANGVLCLHRYKDGRSELLDTINSQMISTSILVVSSGLAFITEGNTSNKQYRSVRIINNKLELGDLKNSGVIGIINQFIKQSGIVWAFIRNGSSFELSQVSVVDTNTLSFGAQTSIHTHVSGSIYSTNITVLDSNRLIFRCSTYVNPDNFIYAKVIDTSGGITVGATKTLYTFSSEGVYYHGIGGSEHIVLDSGKVVFPVFMASTYKLYICDIVGSEIQDGTDTTLSFTNGFAAHSENDSVWKTDDDKILLFGSVSSYRVCYALLEVTGETPSLIEDYYLHEGYSLVIYPSVSNGKEYFLQLASNNHGDYLLPVRYKDGKVYSISIRGSVQVANSYRHYDWIDDKYIIEISKSAYNTIALQVYETDGIFIAKAGIIPTLLTDVYIGDTLYPRVAMTDDLVNGFIFYESSTNYLPYYCPFVINPDKSVTLGTPVSTSTNVSGTHQEIVKIGNNTFLPSFLKTKIYSSPIRFKEGVWQLGAERVHIKSVTASYSKAYRFIEGEGIALFSYYDGTGYYATSAMVLTDTVTNFYIGEWPLTNSWGGLSSSLINDILGFYKDGSFYVITQSNDSTNKDFGMYVSVLPVQAGGCLIIQFRLLSLTVLIQFQ